MKVNISAKWHCGIAIIKWTLTSRPVKSKLSTRFSLPPTPFSWPFTILYPPPSPPEWPAEGVRAVADSPRDGVISGGERDMLRDVSGAKHGARPGHTSAAPPAPRAGCPAYCSLLPGDTKCCCSGNIMDTSRAIFCLILAFFLEVSMIFPLPHSHSNNTFHLAFALLAFIFSL